MTNRLQRLYQSVSAPVAVVGSIIVISLIAVVVLVLTGGAGIPAAIMTASIPVTFGLLGQFVSSDRQNKREIEAKLRERKSAVYEDFMKWWMEILLDKQRQKELLENPEELKRQMMGISQPIMLWASNDIVHAYADFKRRFSQAGQQPGDGEVLGGIVHFEKMLFLMREDMGHDPSGFRQYDLLSFFVNDLHSYVDISEPVTPIKR